MALLKNEISKKNKITITVFLCIWAFFFYIFTRDYPNQQTEYEDFQQRRAQMEQQAQAEQQRLAAMTPEERVADRAAKAKAEQEYEEKVRAEQRLAHQQQVMAQIDVSKDLLTGAELDLKQGHLTAMDMVGIGAMLEVIYSTATSLQSAWDAKDALEKSDITTLKSLEARLASFQKNGLPQMRLAFKKEVASKLWEHDVSVKLNGAGNTKLTLISYQFAANANIKLSYEQLIELLLKLRFKQVEFITDDFTRHGAGYNLETPKDTVIAAYADGFRKLERQKNKP